MISRFTVRRQLVAGLVLTFFLVAISAAVAQQPPRMFVGTIVSGRAYYQYADKQPQKRVGLVKVYLVEGAVAADEKEPLKNQIDFDVTDETSPSTLGYFSFATDDILKKVSIVHFAELDSNKKPHFFSTLVFTYPTGTNTRLSAKVTLPLDRTGRKKTDPQEVSATFQKIILAYALGPRIFKDPKAQMVREFQLLLAASRDIPLDKWYPEALGILRNSESEIVRKFLETVPDLKTVEIDEKAWGRELEHWGMFQ